jgi:hypothetical protein
MDEERCRWRLEPGPGWCATRSICAGHGAHLVREPLHRRTAIVTETTAIGTINNG